MQHIPSLDLEQLCSNFCFDMWFGCVSELVSYFDTCQTDYSDLEPVQNTAELFKMLPCFQLLHINLPSAFSQSKPVLKG